MPFVHLALWVAGLGAVGLLPAAVELRLIGVTELSRASRPDGTRLGGLSGLDYDAAADRWLAVSDDKSEHGPARAYALRIDYDQSGVSAAAATEVISLRRPDGSTYPSEAAPDFEALRIDPCDGSLWYASEGNGERGLPPFVRQADRTGGYLSELPHLRMLAFVPGQKTGLRHNLAFEGLAFAPDGNSLWLAVEGPLWQDGPVPAISAGALTRLTRLARDGTMLAQYAYPLDPVPLAPAAGKQADNGISEILALADNRLLVLERSGRQDESGAWRFTARLYVADFTDATDVGTMPALAGLAIVPMTKRVLLDFATMSLPPVDNLEGLAWGRRLANGHETLVLISDDNFSPNQSTQIWVFEILHANPNPS
jgi:hypothetical protein